MLCHGYVTQSINIWLERNYEICVQRNNSGVFTHFYLKFICLNALAVAWRATVAFFPGSNLLRRRESYNICIRSHLIKSWFLSCPGVWWIRSKVKFIHFYLLGLLVILKRVRYMRVNPKEHFKKQLSSKQESDR